MDIVNDFWLHNPEECLTKLDAFASASKYPVKTIRYGTSFKDRELVALQAGTGPLNVVIVGGMHAAELVSGFGMLAFAYSLTSGRTLDGDDIDDWLRSLYERQTITLVPVHNIDGAVRMSKFLPGCYTRNRFDGSDMDAYSHFVRDPIQRFGLTRGVDHYLTEEQVRIWVEDEGGMLGQLWSDQGVDLFEDWVNLRAPETQGLRKLLDDIRPHCIFEMHNHEVQTQMFVPIPAAEGSDRLVQVQYGEEMMTALMDADIPCSRHSTHMYSWPESMNQFPNAVYRRYGCLVLFAEICFGLTLDAQREMAKKNPLSRRDADAREPTQEEALRGVWIWLKTLIDMGGERGYR